MNPIRFSNLKQMARSPAHYKHALTAPHDETKAMRFGSALDALLFGTKEVLTFEGASRRTKAWTIFADENPEAIKLLAPERVTVDEMLASLKANSEAMDLLAGATQRKSEWSIGGRDCQGTPDVFTPKRVVELKSTRSAHPDWFQWDARKMGYHAQLAWYRNGLSSIELCDPDAEGYIVASESSPPYPVTIFQLSPRAIEEGNKMWRLWFERLLVCESSNAWPAYTQAIVPFDTPDTEALTLTVEGEEMEVE